MEFEEAQFFLKKQSKTAGFDAKSLLKFNRTETVWVDEIAWCIKLKGGLYTILMWFFSPPAEKTVWKMCLYYLAITIRASDPYFLKAV